MPAPSRRALRAAVRLLPLAAAACSGDAQLAWPDALGVHSVIVAHISSALELEVYAGDPPQIPARVEELRPGDRLLVLQYLAAPASVGLVPGSLAAAQPELPNMAVPGADRIWSLDAEAASDGAWQPSEVLPAPLDSLRIPTLPVACLYAGGCLAAGACELPCTPTPAALPEPPAGPMPAEPPIAPAAPELLPCPSGWIARAHAHAPIQSCDPRPLAHVCTGAEVEWLGTNGCAPIGAVCPSGTDRYAADLPASGVLYADPLALPGGDGSRGAPFSSLQLAVAAAAAGATIALARGDFVEDGVTIANGVTLLGACTAETRLVGTRVGYPTVVIAAQRTALRNLTISTVDGALQLLPGSRAVLEDVLLDAAVIGVIASEAQLRGTRVVRRGGQYGIYMVRSRVELEDVVFEGMSARYFSVGTSTSTFRRLRVTGGGAAIDPNIAGISMEVGGSLLLEQALIEQAQRGLAVLPGVRVEARDLVVQDTRYEAAIAYGGSLTLARSHFLRNRGAGLVVQGHADVQADDVLIEQTGYRSGFEAPTGLRAFEPCQVRARRVHVDRAANMGVSLTEGAHMTLEDLTLMGPDGTATSSSSPAIHVNAAGLRLDRARLDGLAGIWLLGASSATISDVWASGASHAGLYAIGATLAATRLQITGARGSALDTQHSTCRVQDLISSDITPDDHGILHLSGGHVELSRVSLLGAGRLGVYADSVATLRIADLSISDQLGTDVWAIHVGASPDLSLERVQIADAMGIGFWFDHVAGRLADVSLSLLAPNASSIGVYLSESAIRAERMALSGFALGWALGPACSLTLDDLRASAGGTALQLVGGSQAHLTRATLQDLSGPGVHVEDAGGLAELTDFTLLGSGACSEHAATGVLVNDAARVVLERFLIAAHPSYGIQIARDSTLSAHDGEVRASCTGLEVNSGLPFSFDDLEGVKLSDNAVPLVLSP